MARRQWTRDRAATASPSPGFADVVITSPVDPDQQPAGLWTRSFTLLASGQAVSGLGDGLFATALVWIALHNGGTTGVAVVATATMAPMLFGSLLAASYADRRDRRRLMILADMVRLVLVAGLAAALWHGPLPITVLAVFAVAQGTASALFAPARLALVPSLVSPRRLLRANGVLQASFMASFGLGPLLIAPLLTVTTMPGVVALDAATFAVSAGTLTALRLTPAQRASPSRTTALRSDLVAGWRAVRAAPEVSLVLLTFVAALMLASGTLAVGLPVWVTRAHGDAGTLGQLQGAAGAAELLGALILTRIRLRRLAVLAVAGWVGLGAFRLFLGTSSRLAAGLPLMAGTGLASAVTDIPLITLLQNQIPREHLGKAMALWYTGIAAATTLSPPLAALAIHGWGLTTTFALSGSGLVALGAFSLARLAIANRPRPATSTEGNHS